MSPRAPTRSACCASSPRECTQDPSRSWVRRRRRWGAPGMHPAPRIIPPTLQRPAAAAQPRLTARGVAEQLLAMCRPFHMQRVPLHRAPIGAGAQAQGPISPKYAILPDAAAPGPHLATPACAPQS
jgi:hypothetical protein